MIDVVACNQVIIGSQGSVNIDYGKGGRAAILIPEYYLRGSNICQQAQAASYQAETGPGGSTNAASTLRLDSPTAVVASIAAVLFGSLMFLGFPA